MKLLLYNLFIVAILFIERISSIFLKINKILFLHLHRRDEEKKLWYGNGNETNIFEGPKCVNSLLKGRPEMT